MSETLDILRSRRQSIRELASVVRTMKAMAASRINLYEIAVSATEKYFRTVSLGIRNCLGEISGSSRPTPTNQELSNAESTGIIVFGSDQGLIGNFNDSLAGFLSDYLKKSAPASFIWTIGERMETGIKASGMTVDRNFSVPVSLEAISGLVNGLLNSIEEKKVSSLYLFLNASRPERTFEASVQKVLPLDQSWKEQYRRIRWPSKTIPKLIGRPENVLRSLLNEYLFVCLYKACAESLASENASRLLAMRRAEKNIQELSENLTHAYNQLRQNSIDTELFDVISGFEALQKKHY